MVNNVAGGLTLPWDDVSNIDGARRSRHSMTGSPTTDKFALFTILQSQTA
jgi:hypothetical protein